MDNKYIYVSGDDGEVVAYDKNNGTVIWKKKIPKREVKKFANFTWTVPGEEGRSGQYRKKVPGDGEGGYDFLDALDALDEFGKGADSWEKSSSDKPDLRMKGGGFFGNFITKTVGGGEKVFINKLSAPFVYGAQVVVRDSQGFVTVLKNDDGEIISQSETDGGAILTRPEHVPNGLVVQTINGGLYAFGIQ